jgi:hypothetical protein
VENEIVALLKNKSPCGMRGGFVFLGDANRKIRTLLLLFFMERALTNPQKGAIVLWSVLQGRHCAVCVKIES